MKPLPSAPLTIEDHDIWCRVWDGPLHARRPAFREIAETGDRRDAELMFERQVHLKAKREMMRRHGWIAHPWIGLGV